MRRFLSGLLLCCFPAAGCLFAQSVWHTNNVTGIGGGCYQLTKNKDGQKGSLWNNQMLNLTEPFDLYMRLNFGTKDQGADGITVVLHQDPAGYAALGSPGADLGYASASYGNDSISPSLNIEFDTYNNGQWMYNDIVDDHCQINAGGIPSWTLAFGVPLLGAGGNVENGLYHLVHISWRPATQMLEVYFNCNLIQSLQVDLVNWLFAGNPYVYYGLTSATGEANNNHYFCELWHKAGNDMTFCPGTPVTLQATSNFQNVSWTPATGLSCTNCLTPVANPAGPMTYVLTGTYDCLVVTDTVKLIQDCTFLPVELREFEGYCKQGAVMLEWTTASELNNSHFDVERSADGTTFVAIGRVNGAGTTGVAQHYEFRDGAPLPGIAYYRLRQVDRDETATFSPVIAVTCPVPLAANVFPNPASDRIFLRLQAGQAQTAQVRCLALSGQALLQAELPVSVGTQVHEIGLNNLPPGLYVLLVQLADQRVALPLAVGN